MIQESEKAVFCSVAVSPSFLIYLMFIVQIKNNNVAVANYYYMYQSLRSPLHLVRTSKNKEVNQNVHYPLKAVNLCNTG
jgi:hypothetical protein